MQKFCHSLDDVLLGRPVPIFCLSPLLSTLSPVYLFNSLFLSSGSWEDPLGPISLSLLILTNTNYFWFFLILILLLWYKSCGLYFIYHLTLSNLKSDLHALSCLHFIVKIMENLTAWRIWNNLGYEMQPRSETTNKVWPSETSLWWPSDSRG